MLQRLNQHWKTWLKHGLLFALSASLAIACTAQQQPTASNSPASQTITVAISPWPGYSAHYVAMAKGLFKEQGLEVKEVPFASQSDSDTAFLAGKVDLNWTGLPNAVPQFSRDPSIQVIYQCDYSNGADGILGRGIKGAADIKGQKIARENVLFEELLLRRYLEKMGVKREEVTTIDLSAADSAAAFTAGKVNLAVTYEPWMTKAAKDGKGEVVFTSKGTNVIPDGVTARKEFAEKNQAAIAAYLKAIDKAVKLIQSNPADVTEPIAKSLAITAAEVPDQLGGVKLYTLQDNKTITFNRSDPMNLYDSLDFASKTAAEIKLIPNSVDINTVMNAALVTAAAS
jgi:NitT/TauT family transport system substrate-binding protein